MGWRPGDGERTARRFRRRHPGALVVVSNGGTAVEATARRDESVRRGAVYLHAAVADPLLRREASAVRVERRSRSTPERE